MKLLSVSIVALLATSSFALAENNRSIFGDGSAENSYIAGQATQNATSANNLPTGVNGRNAFGDGSIENSYSIHSQPRAVATSTYSSIDEGRNGFGDGSPLN